MFLKVFKYDFKAVFFKILPFAIILLIISVTLGISMFFNQYLLDNNLQNPMYYYVEFSFAMVLIALSFVFIIYSYVSCILRYVKSMFKNTGYLTHTLPVSKHTLIISQLLILIIFLILSYSYCALMFFIVGLGYERENPMGYIYEYLISFFIPENWWNLFIFLISNIASTTIIYFSIALGHIRSKNKMLHSFIFLIIIEYILEIIKSILISITFGEGTFLVPEIIYLIMSVGRTQAETQIFSVIFNICLIALGYIGIYHVLNKRLNLE